jgi:hypothetical protein
MDGVHQLSILTALTFCCFLDVLRLIIMPPQLPETAEPHFSGGSVAVLQAIPSMLMLKKKVEDIDMPLFLDICKLLVQNEPL